MRLIKEVSILFCTQKVSLTYNLQAIVPRFVFSSDKKPPPDIDVVKGNVDLLNLSEQIVERHAGRVGVSAVGPRTVDTRMKSFDPLTTLKFVRRCGI